MAIKEKFIQIAENEQRVYEAGKAKGIEEGKQAEYDAFWDVFQNNGNRKSYAYAFGSGGWNDSTFAPKYNLVLASDQTRMFIRSQIKDLKGILEGLGVILDTSGANNLSYLFEESAVTKCPLIDTRGMSNPQRIFYYATALTETTLKLKDDGSQTFTGLFSGCTALTDLEIQGVIGGAGFNVSPCTNLTHDSLMSIINHLKDGVSSVTVTLGSTNLAKLTDTEKAIATQKGWTLA